MCGVKAFILTIFFAPIIVYPQQNIRVSLNSQKYPNHVISFTPVDVSKINVIVAESGKPIGGLKAEDFEVWAGQTGVDIVNVEPLLHTENAKISIVLCIDNSSSMLQNVDFLIATLDKLLNQMGPSVNISTAFFSKEHSLTQPGAIELPKYIKIYDFTKDKNVVRDKFRHHLLSSLINVTFLYDQIYSAINLMTQIEDKEEKRFIIVLSDGIDNASQYDERTLNLFVQQNPGIVIYTIDYRQESNAFLESLAIQTHGMHFQAKLSNELNIIFENITQEIVNLSGYLITYKIPKAVIAGRIVRGSSCVPPEDTEIICYSKSLSGYKVHAKVDTGGNYIAKVDIPHEWIVKVQAPGYESDSTRIEVTEKDVYYFDFSVKPAILKFTGKVIESNLAPLTNASIRVTDFKKDSVLYEGDTDSSGVYEFESLLSNQLLITATKDDYTFGYVAMRKLDKKAILPDIKLRLIKKRAVSEFRYLFGLIEDEPDTLDICSKVLITGCLDLVNRELDKSPTRKVRLVGWTDSLSVGDNSVELSLKMATSFKKYLMQSGIPDNRIEVEGWGINYKYDNSTEEGRALNRRVDVSFYDPRPGTEK